MQESKSVLKKNSAAKTILLVLVLVAASIVVYAQQDTVHAPGGHYKEHLSLYDVFQGPENTYMVCYPKSHRNYFLTGFGLSLLVLIVIAGALWLLKRSNRKIKAAHKIIEAKNDDLLSGIRYSLRIQNAILPEFTAGIHASNCLVYYSPKDIVSGDTYWLAETGNKKIFIIADCTGHGISGAMLTMLFNTAIRKALYEYDLTEPGQILDNINSQIKKSLHQSERTSLSDSADMGIAVLDSGTNTFSFAGANVNMYWHSGRELQLFRGDKCTVGSVQDHVTEPPRTLTGTMKQGDYMVLYTDGVVDQLGTNGKKLKRSGLENILADAFAAGQPQAVAAALSSWKGGEEQVDDMTLICYKV